MKNYIKEIAQLEIEKQSILSWFQVTDYYPNKVFRGEWEETDERIVKYKKEAKEKSLRLEKIQEEIKLLENEFAEFKAK